MPILNLPPWFSYFPLALPCINCSYWHGPRNSHGEGLNFTLDIVFLIIIFQFWKFRRPIERDTSKLELKKKKRINLRLVKDGQSFRLQSALGYWGVTCTKYFNRSNKFFSLDISTFFCQSIRSFYNFIY